MLRWRFDLPLGEDGSSRFLPWIVALMVYLAALAAAAGIVADSAVERWSTGLEGTLTVEITPDAASAAATDERVRTALELLRTTAGVLTAEPLPPEDVAALLEPWLGAGALPADLPVPRMIDVRLEPGTLLDVSALATQIEALVPGARMDDHRQWRERLAAFGRAVAAATMLIVGLVTVSAAATVIFATRAGLEIHRDVIELLHLIGSRESYIARQFQSHAMWLALKGGVAGAALGLVTLFVIGRLAAPLEGAFLPEIAVGLPAWITVAALPLAAAFVATVTARITVVRTLRKM